MEEDEGQSGRVLCRVHSDAHISALWLCMFLYVFVCSVDFVLAPREDNNVWKGLHMSLCGHIRLEAEKIRGQQQTLPTRTRREPKKKEGQSLSKPPC